MGRINRADLRKSVYYLKRNGVRRTWCAVRERLEEKRRPPYVWAPPTEAELANQRRLWEAGGHPFVFSLLVPAYRTKPEYLRELIESLRSQTYPGWELILADATEDDSVERAVRGILELESAEAERNVPESRGPGEYEADDAIARADGPAGDAQGAGCADSRVRYIRLEKNEGIAENTNRALRHARGDYVGLLDHDDVLTEDALHEMAAAIEEGRRKGCTPRMLYSDEDKCNGDRTEYYEPNRKEDFNLDLLLSNNYICHFLVMERELIQRLKFRPEYDGAQDYDLVLRAVAELEREAEPGRDAGLERKAKRGRGAESETIVHIPKVLYHWRCHTTSTAENPRSKLYAYEAGRRAIQDFADRQSWRAEAVDTDHVGFYTLRYEGDLFESRRDVGAVGGRLVCGGRICGGRLSEDGRVFYENLPIRYSGYLHRAVLPQDAAAVDIRNIRIRPECRGLFEEVTGIPYRTIPGGDVFDASLLPEDSDWRGVSLELGRALRKAGYRILYLPEPQRGKLLRQTEKRHRAGRE